MPSDVPAEPPGPTRWRVRPALAWAKAAGVLIFVFGFTLATDAVQRSAAATGVVVLGLYALRDVVAPVRLAADPDGLTVIVGYAGRRRLAWSQVELIRVDDRERFGLRSRMLEIDAGESLHLFSEYDLGASVEDVAEELARLRQR